MALQTEAPQAQPVDDDASTKPTPGTLGAAVLPDALVYTNSALLSGDKKHFALANPTTGTAVHVIKHADRAADAPAWLGGPFKSFSHVESITYSAAGDPVRHEDGIGTSMDIGKGRDKMTFFLNTRGGDTNALDHPKTGASVNLGLFGPPEALERFVDNLPRGGGKAGKLRQALERSLDVAGVGGSQYGLGWRGTVTHDRESGKAILDISGYKIELEDFIDTFEEIGSLNRGDRPVAALNNEEAYLRGANPFVRAEQTRETLPDGSPGRYLNHGEPVAAISGDTLALQRSVAPGEPPIPPRNGGAVDGHGGHRHVRPNGIAGGEARRTSRWVFPSRTCPRAHGHARRRRPGPSGASARAGVLSDEPPVLRDGEACSGEVRRCCRVPDPGSTSCRSRGLRLPLAYRTHRLRSGTRPNRRRSCARSWCRG